MRLAARSIEDGRRRNPPVQREDASDPMTPQQYYDMIANRRDHQDGETRLLFAVLEDAIRCHAIARNSPARSSRREFEEVREWVNTRGDHDVFAFDSICAIFSIEPETLRSQLNAMRIENFPTRRMRSVGRRTALTVPD